MNDEIKIFYNNVDLFSGIGPTPFVTFSQDFIDFNTGWNQITNLSLNGQITGFLGSNSNQVLNNKLKTLVSRLSNNYKPIKIQQNNTILFDHNYCIINNINIDNNNFYGVLPYSIDINIFETGLFKINYGVSEPQETFSFVEEDGLIVSLKHNISAKGITNNSTALQNAKSWVLSRTGNYQKVLPSLVRMGSGYQFLIDSVNETIDRFNGTYSWEANYIKCIHNESPSNSILNYTIDINSDIQNNFITVNIDGNLTKNNIDQLRSGFNNLKIFNIANDAANRLFNTSLNQKPISQSIIELKDENILQFNIVYNNDLESNIVNDYNVSISTDSLKNISEVTLNADIFGKYGDVSSRWNDVKNYYYSSFKPFELANNEYKKEINDRLLYSNILTESIKFDEYNARINYTASWSTKNKPDGLLNFSSSVTYTPSVSIHVPHTSAFTARDHNIQNLKTANLSVLNITVSAQALPNYTLANAQSKVNQEIDRIKLNYGILNSSNKFLENNEVTKDSENKFISVNQTWKFGGGVIT